MKERWFILTVTKEDFPTLVGSLTSEERGNFSEDADTVRWNLLETQCVVQLKEGKDVPKIIEHLTPLSTNEILIEMAKTEWTNEEII